MPDVYKECLVKAVERKDMEECEHLLRLFECTYQAFYTALNEEEKMFRERPYQADDYRFGNGKFPNTVPAA